MSNSQTLERQAYDVIRQHVIAGTYKPGSHLTEALLVEDLQMSRTPIRRALGKLETEGIIKHRSHHGSIVQDIRISMQEVINMIELRNIFVTACIQKAERKQLSFPIENMRECIKTMEGAYEQENSETYFRAAQDWNNFILIVSHNHLMQEVSDNLWNRFFLGANNNIFKFRKQGIPRTIKQFKEATNLLEQKKYSEAIELLNNELKKVTLDFIS